MSYQHWILTIPENVYTVPTELPNSITYLKGQLEEGGGGFRHYQIYCVTAKKVRPMACKALFPPETHVEFTRSDAARAYVWKDDTSVGNRFCLGHLPMRRNNKTDWENVKKKAKLGELEDLSADIYIQHYRTLKAIEKDHMQPLAQEKNIIIYHGKPGTGKSRRAWEEAGYDAYPKDPNTKYWDGYQGQENVVMDEFRGKIDISHLLRWLDRYPVSVETKFGGCVLRAKKIWITSNIPPVEWYPQLDEDTKNALLRRISINEYFSYREEQLRIITVRMRTVYGLLS